MYKISHVTIVKHYFILSYETLYKFENFKLLSISFKKCYTVRIPKQ